jgi:hypothetical protein
VIGAVIFLWGIVGWVVIDDTKMYPGDSSEPQGEVHH